jgi:hypothetical protein
VNFYPLPRAPYAKLGSTAKRAVSAVCGPGA